MPLAVTVFTWLPSNFHAVSANSVVELAMHALGKIGMTQQPTISWQMLLHLSLQPQMFQINSDIPIKSELYAMSLITSTIGTYTISNKYSYG